MSAHAPQPFADVERLLASSELPTAIQARVRAIVGAARLRPAERVDVTRELIAHFQDGLAAGGSAAALLEAFGDNADAAAMIQAAKRRGRGTANEDGLLGTLTALLGDLRYAIRRLRQSPGFATTAILSLAIGIGANTAVFSVVNGLLLRDVAAARPAELVNVYQTTVGFPYNVFSYPDYEDLLAGTEGVFSDLSGSMVAIGVRDAANGVETLLAEAVTGSYFPLLEITPAAGRLLGPDDDVTLGAHPVVVLGHAFWRRAYAGDPSVVGTDVVLSGTPYTIVGVAPASYAGMTRGLMPDAFISIRMADTLEGTANSKLTTRRNHALFVRGRLRAGISIEQASQAAEAVAVRLREEQQDVWEASDGFRLKPTREVVLFPMFDGPITAGAWLLLGVVGLVLLIACANLASFLLARAVDRRKEVAVRLALGAGRRDLIRQFMVETMVLSLLGGAAGVAVAAWCVRAVATMDFRFPIPLHFDFSIDATVLGFSLAVSLLAGVLFGLAPALQASSPDLVSTLRDEAAGGGRAGRNRLRNTLVIGQVATSVVLLIGAGLFLRSLQAIYDFDPGFGQQPAAVLTFAIPGARYDDADIKQILNELGRQFKARPDVKAAGFITNLHLSQTSTSTATVVVDGVPAPDDRAGHVVDYAAADAAFFEAAGIPLIDGRLFDSRDTNAVADVIIVSQAFAEQFWPGTRAIGQVVRSAGSDNEMTVVGVAADTKVRTLGEPARPFLYAALDQVDTASLALVASTRGSPRATATALMAALRDRVPEVLIYSSQTMDDHLETVRFPSRLAAMMFTLFAIIALILATIGLYGLISYTQAQRIQEVGIRMSLGADPRSVVVLLIRGGMRLVWIGIGVGVAMALGATRVLGGLLFGVAATDVGTFVAVVVLLTGVALIAAWVPARRASRIDPVQALRTE
jgi:predicted permease